MLNCLEARHRSVSCYRAWNRIIFPFPGSPDRAKVDSIICKRLFIVHLHDSRPLVPGPAPQTLNISREPYPSEQPSTR